MDTKVSTQTLTNTHKAVFVTTGILASFFIGLAFLSALSHLVAPIPPPAAPAAQLVKDVTMMYVQSSEWDSKVIALSGDYSNNPYTFGTYENQMYLHSGSEQNARPLIVVIPKPSEAMILSLDIVDPYISNTAPSNDMSFLGIKTAHAQLNVNTLPPSSPTIKFPVCVPKTTLVKGAVYYVDVQGNTYWDKARTRKANPGSCPTIIAKTYYPSKIDSGTFSAPFPNIPPVTGYLAFIRNFEVLGWYNYDTHAADPTTDTTPAIKTPLMIKMGTMLDEDLQQPLHISATSVSLTAYVGTTTNIETLSLCIPETTIPAWSANYVGVNYFYDNTGKPYSDVLLQNAVPCTATPPPTCNATTCPTGCCINNQCLPGNVTASCGTNGNTCTACLGNQQCVNGLCTLPPSGCTANNGICEVATGCNEYIDGSDPTACDALKTQCNNFCNSTYNKKVCSGGTNSGANCTQASDCPSGTCENAGGKIAPLSCATSGTNQCIFSCKMGSSCCKDQTGINMGGTNGSTYGCICTSAHDQNGQCLF